MLYLYLLFKICGLVLLFLIFYILFRRAIPAKRMLFIFIIYMVIILGWSFYYSKIGRSKKYFKYYIINPIPKGVKILESEIMASLTFLDADIVFTADEDAFKAITSEWELVNCETETGVSLAEFVKAENLSVLDKANLVCFERRYGKAKFCADCNVFEMFMIRNIKNNKIYFVLREDA